MLKYSICISFFIYIIVILASYDGLIDVHRELVRDNDDILHTFFSFSWFIRNSFDIILVYIFFFFLMPLLWFKTLALTRNSFNSFT